MYYFIRVNGASVHTDPANKNCFVEKEPEEFRRVGYSNYLNYCLTHNFVRIGWPDVGDIKTGDRKGAKSNCYNWNTKNIITDEVSEYLKEFSAIKVASIVLVPNRDKPGDVYIGVVAKPYWYEIDGPYECSHRIGVNWDCSSRGEPVAYSKEELGIYSYGGFWRRAFAIIQNPKVISAIRIGRERKNI